MHAVQSWAWSTVSSTRGPVLAIAFALSCGPCTSYSQTRTDNPRPVALSVALGWKDEANRAGPAGVTMRFLLWPDHMTVSSGKAMQPEAENFQRECTKNLKVGRDGKMSEETIIKFMDCDNKSTRMNLLSASSHAIMLPLFAGPRKCNETKLSRGSYRICAALLEKKTDGLKIEYEEDVDYGGNLYAYRARFYMALFGDQYHITDCKVQLVDAFSFNPRKPEKLLPFVRKTLERCDVFPASAAEEMQQIREGLTR